MPRSEPESKRAEESPVIATKHWRSCLLFVVITPSQFVQWGSSVPLTWRQGLLSESKHPLWQQGGQAWQSKMGVSHVMRTRQ